MVFLLTLTREPFQADWKLGRGTQIPVQISENENEWLALVGRIYGNPTPDLNQLRGELTAFPDAAMSKQGRFVFIRVDKRSGDVQIWTDKYRLLGAFIHNDGGQVRIGNGTRLDESFFAGLPVDPTAVTDLLSFGYVLPPLTLYKNMHMLSGYAIARSNSNVTEQHDWRYHWPQSQPQRPEGAASEFFNLFRDCTNQIVKEWKPRTFRMSAGADTRLINASLTEESKRSLKFEVVCAPYLSEDSDRDVIGARQVASVSGCDIEVKHFPPATSAYFAELLDESPALGGLYGGEFLGGVLFSTDPSVATNASEIIPAGTDLQMTEAQWSESRSRWQADLNRFGTQGLLTSVYLGSFRSTIYQSVNFSWASPSQLFQVTISPFTEGRVLDFLLALPADVLKNYAFYAEAAVNHLPEELKKIPFSSPIVNFTKELPPFIEGADPKFRVHVSEETTQPVKLELLRRLERMGIQADQDNSVLRQRLLNLQNVL